MEFDIVHLEVEGTMANPAIAAAFWVSATALSGITWVVVGWIYAVLPTSPERWRRRRRIGLFFLAFLFLASTLGQLVLATYFYRMVYEMGPFDSVGFWPGPPVLPMWALAVTAGFLSVYRHKARLRQIVASTR
jgi:uncharacterized BrkB/YihY/UPF0761 family membrane protein